MPIGEKVNLLVMRDNGEVRSVRMRLSLLIGLCGVSAVMPLVAAGGLWFAAQLWQQQQLLTDENYYLRRESQENKVKSERLSNLEVLLQRKMATETIVISNASRPETKEPAAAYKVEDENSAVQQEGPGHSEFPAIKTDFIAVGNASVRLQAGNKLRISLDLRNPDARKPLTGAVTGTLITAAGDNVPLPFRPADAGDFRITRLKRAVLVSLLPPQISLTNAQVVIEVKSEGGELVYRNIFPVER